MTYTVQAVLSFFGSDLNGIRGNAKECEEQDTDSLVHVHLLDLSHSLNNQTNADGTLREREGGDLEDL